MNALWIIRGLIKILCFLKPNHAGFLSRPDHTTDQITNQIWPDQNTETIWSLKLLYSVPFVLFESTSYSPLHHADLPRPIWSCFLFFLRQMVLIFTQLPYLLKIKTMFFWQTKIHFPPNNAKFVGFFLMSYSVINQLP